MSTIISSGSDEKRCRFCNVLLVPEENWWRSSAKINIKVCKECDTKRRKESYQKSKLLLTPEDREFAKKERRKERMLDPERIKRLIEWIQEYNIRYYANEYISQVQGKLPEGADLEANRMKLEDEIKTWTYETVKDKKREDFEVLTEVLLRHKILTPKYYDGDTGWSWFVAFHECGYEGYDLDGDGLPLARPGRLRMAQFGGMRRRADTKWTGRDGRTGIVVVPYLEVPRRKKVEWRILVLDDLGTWNTLDGIRRLRHSRENDQMAKLKTSLNTSVDQKQDLVDALVGIYNRT